MTHNRKRYVKTRYWNTRKNPDFFPELHDPAFSSEYIKERKDFGVCFSGGGTRSAAATLGQLRGLKNAGLLEKIGYMSAVSGGSWGSAAFVFLPQAMDEDIFLGAAIPPEELGMEILGQEIEGSMAKAISKTVIGDDILREILERSGDEAYSRAIGQLFVEPFGLHSLNRYIAFDEKTLATTLAANSRQGDADYYLTGDDFIMARPKRPFYIANATLLRERNDDVREQKMHCEFTPIYSGVRSWFADAGRRTGFLVGEKRPIGGGYIQTHAYDSTPKEFIGDTGLIGVSCARRCFTLSDIIGSSGAAPEETVRDLGMTFTGFPEFRHFAVPQDDHNTLARAAEYAHGDGGHLENFGLIPLLARKVKNIIVFMNSPTPFTLDGSCNDDLAPLFGRDDYPVSKKGKFDPVKVAVNRVFAPAQLDEIIQTFQMQKTAGQPLVHIGKFQVEDNSHYNIGRYQATICWVYLDCPDSWKNRIGDGQLKTMIGEKHSMFKRFPHYRTFMENGKTIIDLTIEQVNLLSQLTCWTVMTSRDTIIDRFDL